LEKPSLAQAVIPRAQRIYPMKGLPNWFVPLWCIAMPVTSLLIVPSVQGTIPAYMLAFVSAFFVLVSRGDETSRAQRRRYITVAVVVAAIWLVLLCGSQIGNLVSNRHDFGDMFLINPDDTKVVLRSSLFTQTIYLAACLCIALFFRFCFRPEWMRYVLWGGWFLAIYGIYEWLFFLVFQQPGDFIANRTYGAEEHTGSWSQGMQVGSLMLLRMKSTFGEPSWFSAGVIPYLFLALENKRKWLSTALLFCVVLSMSTSAYVGFPVALFLQSLFRRKISTPIIVVVVLFVTAFTTLYFIYPETYNQMFTAKMSGENDSGQVRQDAGQAMRETMDSFGLMNRVFGIGFGYYYGGVFYSVLVNTGLIGMLVYLYAFLKPVFWLRAEEGNIALKVGLGTIFFLFWVSVSELFLPTTWMFLGLAYWRLDQQKQTSRLGSTTRIGPPAQGRLAHAGEV
jgi:hypothetical protein